MPKFSIIVPVYNVAPYLRECLDSVLHQTFTDWECLCVNDGSTDESGAILDEYARKDKRFRVFHKPNGGVSSARNLALDNVRGEWVGFLDGDDIYHMQLLEVLQYNIQIFQNVELFKFEYVDCYNDLNWHMMDIKQLPINKKDISRSMTMIEFYNFCCQYYYKRSILNNLKFPMYAYGEDRIFLASVLLYRVKSFVSIFAAFYGYRQRLTSAMHKQPTLKILKEEMCHRRDILLMIENSSKSLFYANSRWLEGYFISDFARKVKYLPVCSRREAWNLWFSCVKKMRFAKGLSKKTRIIYSLCVYLPWFYIWWIMVYALPLCYRFCRRLLIFLRFLFVRRNLKN